MTKKIAEIMRFKEMIKSLVRKELRTRYKGSFLGFLWTFVNPLLQLAVYSIIFPYVMRIQQENYAMFLFVALVPWNFFTSVLQGSCGLIVNNSSLVTKVYFPREVLPLSYAISGFLNLCFGYMVVIPMLAIFGIPLTWNMLWLPMIFIIQFVLCAGIAFFACAINVYFRDLEFIISILTMALYFMTPIMYSIDAFPMRLQKLILLNPMAGLVMSYRDVMYLGVGPDFNKMLYPTLFAVVLFIIGFIAFGKLQKNFTEIL